MRSLKTSRSQGVSSVCFRSSASTPDTRYNRSISNIEILSQDESSVELCF